MSPDPGQLLELEIGQVAHGGHCVARHEGQVVFVRHALPGERVMAEVTGSGQKGRFLRADAVEVLRAAPGRRVAPCPVALRCGGCDWQHATPAMARELKAAVVRESLSRIAGVQLPADFVVAEVPFAPDGLGWRTRGTLAVDQHGRAGFRGPRSHEVVVAGQCPQLDQRLGPLGLFDCAWPPGQAVRFAAPAVGEPVARVAGVRVRNRDGSNLPGPGGVAPADSELVGESAPVVHEQAEGRRFAVAWDGFWQAHPRAADTLVGHVRRMLAPRAGELLLDLYSGVGLFGISLAAACPGLRALMVEGDRTACELAVGNAAGLDVHVRRADVGRWVGRRGGVGRRDLVVLDPPRSGAGANVVRAIAAARPRVVAYVACDPVALARDLSTFSAEGYLLDELVGLDLFPTTHHVECVARLVAVPNQ